MPDLGRINVPVLAVVAFVAVISLSAILLYSTEGAVPSRGHRLGIDYPCSCLSRHQLLQRSNEARLAFNAQYNQDRYVYAKYFRFAQHESAKGTYIEFGALDGRLHSNTLAFEDGMQWTGILAEPSPNHSKHIRHNRPRAIVHEGAFCGTKGIRDYYGFNSPGLSGFSDTLDPHMVSLIDQGKHWLNKQGYNVIKIQCSLLHELLDEIGVRHINYWSLDTEGSEYEILESFPFHRIRVDLLQVETHQFGCILNAQTDYLICKDNAQAVKIIRLMEGHGFVLDDQYIVDDHCPSTESDLTVDLFFRAKTFLKLASEDAELIERAIQSGFTTSNVTG